MRLDKYINEIEELGIGVNMTETKELTVKFSDVASTTSPSTRNNKGRGLFGGRLSHAIYRLYANLHPLMYNYVLQLHVLQSRHDLSNLAPKR
jgi:hypothetical protein